MKSNFHVEITHSTELIAFRYFLVLFSYCNPLPSILVIFMNDLVNLFGFGQFCKWLSDHFLEFSKFFHNFNDKSTLWWFLIVLFQILTFWMLEIGRYKYATKALGICLCRLRGTPTNSTLLLKGMFFFISIILEDLILLSFIINILKIIILPIY